MKRPLTFRPIYLELAKAERNRTGIRLVTAKTIVDDTQRPNLPQKQYDNAPGMRRTLTVEDNSSVPYMVSDEVCSIPGWDKKLDGSPNSYPVARSRTGKYIGDPKLAKRLVQDYGVVEFLTQYEALGTDKSWDSVVNVARCSDGGWLGWSHRALYKFKPGMQVEEGDCGYEYVRKKLGGKPWVLKTDADAKHAACYFASSVS